MDSILKHVPNAALFFFAAAGLAFVATMAISYLRLLTSLFILPGIPIQKFAKKGSWAVVTGASDGIGKEFATQLAQKGVNVVLVSRTDSKLKALAQELETKFASQSVKAKTFAMDFAKNSDEDYAKLQAMLESLDVSILVNNVGRSHEIPVPFVLTPEKEIADIININCFGTLRVTQIVAPGMVKRRNGLILTMGSFGGLLPTPLLATYSGSKAFLQQWSTALGSELKPHGIEVELVISYLVTSAMSKIRKSSMTIPNPKVFVRSVLGSIGRSGGAQGTAFTSTPFWSHAIMHWFISTFTGTSSSIVVEQNRGFHESIRKRALRKQEREGKKTS